MSWTRFVFEEGEANASKMVTDRTVEIRPHPRCQGASQYRHIQETNRSGLLIKFDMDIVNDAVDDNTLFEMFFDASMLNGFKPFVDSYVVAF